MCFTKKRKEEIYNENSALSVTKMKSMKLSQHLTDFCGKCLVKKILGKMITKTNKKKKEMKQNYNLKEQQKKLVQFFN